MTSATFPFLRQTETVEEPIEEDADATEEPEKEAEEEEAEVEEEEEDKEKPKTKKVGGSKVGVARIQNGQLHGKEYYLVINPLPLIFLRH